MVNIMLNKFYKNKISKYIIKIENIPHVYDDAFKDALDEMIINKLGVGISLTKNDIKRYFYRWRCKKKID